MTYIPISQVQDYSYCPKNAWYRARAIASKETADLVEGALLHERSDSAVRTVVGKIVQTRTVFLYSDIYGLTGIADLIEETPKGEIYPVEYKKGQGGERIQHQVQLCAQALCLEEMLALKRQIPYGYIYYAASGTRKKIRLSRGLRTTTVSTIKALRKLLDADRPPGVRYSRKCPKCSFVTICLPHETEVMRKRKRRQRIEK
jgi:CRISPR-associated exonuclease Cas4